MTVIDKYKPVRQEPQTVTPVRSVLPGVFVSALALLVFSADSLQTFAFYEDDLPAPVSVAIEGIHGVSEATGVLGLRRGLDALVDPLNRTAKLFRKDDGAPAAAEDDEVPAEPVEPTLPPGERWAASPLRDRPTRILIVGASSIQHAIGTELQRELEARYQDLVILRKGKVSTGLARPDVFDWPSEVAALMDEFQPDVVIGQFGGNDAQNMMSDAGPQKMGSEGWVQEYTRRVTDLSQAIVDHGALPIMVGMPVMRSEGFNRRIGIVNDVTRASVQSVGGLYLSLTEPSADDKGRYKASVMFDGRSGRMRMDDGIHFTRLGGQFMARFLSQRLERNIVLFPKDDVAPEGSADNPVLLASADTDQPAPAPEPTKVEGPAPAYRITIPSERRGPSDALAYVPHDVPAEGLPVWYLLHGAWGSWEDWPDHAHEVLAELADEHRMIIVTPDGMPHGWYLDSPVRPEHQLGTWLVTDLLDAVESQLPADGRRAISGNSMGGHGALHAALSRPAAFETVTSMSGVTDLTHAASREHLQELLGTFEAAPTAWTSRSALHRVQASPYLLSGTRLMLSCGDQDTWWGPNQRFHEALTALGISHTWDPQQGGHTWDLWVDALPRHAAFVAAPWKIETPPAQAAELAPTQGQTPPSSVPEQATP